jgi:ABC-type dipeptide/oligopeptide/nickel transport system permease subunit
MVAVTIPQVRSRRERRGRARRLVPAVPLTILGLMVVSAIFAPLLAPFDPDAQSLKDSMEPPFWLHGGSFHHPLGTDSFGRDELSRLLFATRVSLGVAALAILIAVVVGTTVGILAGYWGGTIDTLSMRFVDMILALPTLLCGLAISIAVGPSFLVVVLVIGLLIWPVVARLVRAETQLLMHSEFVRYARSIGVPLRSIVRRHLIPNMLPTILVATTLQVGSVILTEASLSFLGAGVPPSEASWGGMISDGQGLIATGWWVALFPGLGILVTVVCFNTVGDWLGRYVDPRSRGRAG